MQPAVPAPFSSLRPPFPQIVPFRCRRDNFLCIFSVLCWDRAPCHYRGIGWEPAVRVIKLYNTPVSRRAGNRPSRKGLCNYLNVDQIVYIGAEITAGDPKPERVITFHKGHTTNLSDE